MDSITNLLLSSFLCSILVVSTTAVNTISTTQSVKDGDTIVSIGGSFALRFFSPGSSKNRYVGIWYNKISNDSRTVVWVANRETPRHRLLGHFNGYPTRRSHPPQQYTKYHLVFQFDKTRKKPSCRAPGIREFGNETYFNYDLLNSSVVTRMVMNQDGVLRCMAWIEGSSTSWVEHLTTEITNCDTFASCGPYGLCTVSNSPECGCLQGFELKFPKDWGMDWSNGCQAGHNWNKAKTIIVISVVSTATLILGLAISLYIWKKKEWQKREGRTIGHPEQGYYQESKNEDIELPLFHLVAITKATDNFAINNKLGEGGFGPVYKGMLEGGQEIALQHRNLVKLLGYCIQGEERMLIYEFMPNNNLDSFIFDQSQKMLLDWPKRFHIINGIARGLLYLHQDSRLKIIHRDLKGSNILLDYEMNPKILDFGLARIFGANERQANTKKVIGTYGYMSPEYAIEGLFSVKSDVFSFGVLVLEIVSGKRTGDSITKTITSTFSGMAWRLYKEDRTRELIDEPIQNSRNILEVLHSIHVGLLCVQQRPKDRPNMASVVLLLGGEGALTHPKQPGFFIERNLLEAESTGSEVEQCSANMVSTTVVEAR
ncbi:unnamed protein product [Camellia sinensis]